MWSHRVGDASGFVLDVFSESAVHKLRLWMSERNGYRVAQYSGVCRKSTYVVERSERR